MIPTIQSIPPHAWAKPDPDPLKRSDHKHLEGQRINLQPRSGIGRTAPSRTGTILLVSASIKNRGISAYIKIDPHVQPKHGMECEVCKAPIGTTDKRKENRACTECNRYYHKTCVQPIISYFPPKNRTWHCPTCNPNLATRTISRVMISEAREAIARYTRTTLETRRQKETERTKNIIAAQSASPTTTLYEVHSTPTTVFTVRREQLFDGKWMSSTTNHATEATISHWKCKARELKMRQIRTLRRG